METLPQINQNAAEKVLADIDELRGWCQDTISKLDKGFVRLAALLAEVRREKYYLIRGYKSEEEYIAATFPKSRATYYELLKIGRDLVPQYTRNQLEEIGHSKCLQLIKIKNHCGNIEANWFLHAKADTRDEFKHRVSDYLSKKTNDPAIERTFITFCVYGEDISVVNRAFDVMAKVTGSPARTSGAALVAMCYEFLSGYNEDGSGRSMASNTLKLKWISDLVQQLDYNEPGVGDRLCGAVAGGVERARDVTVDVQG